MKDRKLSFFQDFAGIRLITLDSGFVRSYAHPEFLLETEKWLRSGPPKIIQHSVAFYPICYEEADKQALSEAHLHLIPLFDQYKVMAVLEGSENFYKITHKIKGFG